MDPSSKIKTKDRRDRRSEPSNHNEGGYLSKDPYVEIDALRELLSKKDKEINDLHLQLSAKEDEHVRDNLVGWWETGSSTTPKVRICSNLDVFLSHLHFYKFAKLSGVNERMVLIAFTPVQGVTTFNPFIPVQGVTTFNPFIPVQGVTTINFAGYLSDDKQTLTGFWGSSASVWKRSK
jgi:hypothetical protein